MDHNTEHSPKLFQLVPSSGGKGRVLNKRRLIIGSADACDIRLNASDVNPIHAVIEIGRDHFKIYDMNSKNGTFVNNQKVVAQKFNLGDQLRFSTVSFTFKNYDAAEVMPPTLDMLDPGMPPRMEKSPSLPSSPFKQGEKEDTSFVPEVVYPLAKDPKAEFSEYIFEDADNLFPIFKYDHSSVAVEVIILHNDLIYSVDYIPLKSGTYKLVGAFPQGADVEYPYLAKNETVPFIEIEASGGGITVNPLNGYECLRLSDDSEQNFQVKGNAPLPLRHGDILRFKKEAIQIFVRGTQAPPKVASAPFFRREEGLKTYLLLMFLLVFGFMGAVLIYEPEKEVEKEKVPERIATILYKKRIFVPKEKPEVRPIMKEEQKPKAPVPENEKPKEDPKVIAKVDPKTNEMKPMTGDPKKTVTKQVKKAEPNKGPVDNIVNKVSPAAASANKAADAGAETRKAPVNSNSKGHVDTYKAVDFNSTVSSLLAKGGSVSGSATASNNSGSNTGLTGLAAGTEAGATLKTATVSNNVGSLTGAASGALDTSKGVEGLTNKRSIYTAGLPYKTVVLGGMDPDIIRRILQEHIPQFRYCYQKELDTASQSFSGIVRLDFIIGASGHVTNAGVKAADETLPSSVKGCVVSVLKGIKFPAPPGGGVVEVNQPFNFYPKM
jgi:outer membrane biosynthesis protein TonB